MPISKGQILNSGKEPKFMTKSSLQYLLVEPVAKTPFPPLGLMKISSMLKKKNKNNRIFAQVGNQIPQGLTKPKTIYITSLFTWDIDKVINSIQFYRDKFPRANIQVGGIAASLMPDYIENKSGIKPHIGLLQNAEKYSPDYSFDFGRKLNASITFASRGCPRNCRFCSVKVHEPEFSVRDNWEKDICKSHNKIIFWDNNWLASPNLSRDCEKLERFDMAVDFNQGLDARLYGEKEARLLSKIKIDPIRFAFDTMALEKKVLKAIRYAKQYSNGSGEF